MDLPPNLPFPDSLTPGPQEGLLGKGGDKETKGRTLWEPLPGCNITFRFPAPTLCLPLLYPGQGHSQRTLQLPSPPSALDAPPNHLAWPQPHRFNSSGVGPGICIF